ncbi:MAG: hypothetical protein CGU28_01815 [Candidatus Dactylopiibacterium carminicum]|uniref:C4-dicarboxylate ABC transporter n=1 Tax=Candidatus Dactylopiibacterium carminicum TaxID=857335 RepID=A0A272ETI3_9RHOO|nr:TRAP transporter substrate-binding protein DctP [Candidatus Dactylopiibacterium carminicum]KAF7599356.1 hypothetical protein BGI27_08310 [Candidatus Dactylopiibacterium carminicum]PAS93366.1 MAG: hypothetical protein CGU29_07960 [Candidatus Dactylopiibacterium carminicum]PAS98320.1 MAG: hypothetical protein CGU28_01815 [Candidatus Dactylopiibacterium carminicum]PAS99364.1 MAG: hypothetical protein BSR46_08340 [Candidatus Dactylopiibacterium carminicum]
MSLVHRFLLALAMLLCAPAFAAGPAAWSPQEADHPSTVSLRAFLERMRSITGSAPDTVLPVAVGRNQTALYEALRKEEIRVAVMTSSAVGRVAPMARVMNLPYILANSRQMFSMLDGEIGQQMEAQMAANGLVVLGWYDGATRTMYSRKKLDSVSALQNVKIRIPSRKDLSSLVESLGGVPQKIDYEQVNSSFDQGQIDAAENDLLSYETEGHYKRAPYYYLNNNHIVQFEALVVTKSWFDKLPVTQREALKAAGRESAAANRKTWTDRMAKARTRLEKEGVKFVEYGNSGVLLSRAAAVYRPYMQDPATRDLLVTLMTSRM